MLGCLTVESMSGYNIRQFVDDCIARFSNESYGQIYPTLARLEKEGLVEGRTEPGERGREKRVVRITAAGREELEETGFRSQRDGRACAASTPSDCSSAFNAGPEASVDYPGVLFAGIFFWRRNLVTGTVGAPATSP